MKRITFSLLLFLSCVSIYAQSVEYKFGKVSKSELEMTSYEKDKDAEAAILFEDVQVYFNVSNNNLQLYTEVFQRVKILKESGKNYANFSFKYLSNIKFPDYVKVEAVSYNLVNGKEVKTKLDKKMVFTEVLDKNYSRKKFSAPDVRVGTVVEMRYKIISDMYEELPPLNIQHSIPTLKGKYVMSIPEYYKYTVNTRGFIPLNLQKKIGHNTISQTVPPINYSTSEFYLEQTDVPALKNAPFVWAVDDYRAGMDFELSGFQFYDKIKNFARTWKDVNRYIDGSQFGDDIKMKNPYRDEVAMIKSKGGSELEILNSVIALVHSKINWDGKRSFYSENVGKAVKNGAGSSSDKNYVLAAALRDAGFTVTPILLSTRDEGMLPQVRASYDKINSFNLQVGMSNGVKVYVDGADEHSTINVLPTNLLVSYARTYVPNQEGVAVDLSHLVNNNKAISINAHITPDGKLEGNVINSYSNQFAYRMSKSFAKYKSMDEFIESEESTNGMSIDSMKAHIAVVNTNINMVLDTNLQLNAWRI